MCGITGFWDVRPLAQQSEKILSDMTRCIKHRGPDGFGYHFDEKNGLAMGHARLSIIDINTGAQPLFSEAKKQVLTVNGEYYDYKRIRTNLKLNGFRFNTKSDSEIALPLYKKHGLDFVKHLRGEFAFALFDNETQKLVLVRDRFGIKPLFYHIGPKTVYWGSEIKALFKHPDIPKSFSSRGLIHQLMQTMVPGTTAFENIHALKPGTMLIISKSGDAFDVQEKTYWDMDFPKIGENDKTPSIPRLKAKTQELLLEAVAHRLEADVPVGCYLSGGIDSCSMLGLASSMQQSPVKAFTISFDDKNYDESRIAKEMAERVGADQEQIQLDAASLYGDNFIQTLYHSERSIYNTLGVAKWCMSRRVNECGYRVVVTGEGADELFGGYPAFKRDMFKYGLNNAKASEISAHQNKMDKTNALFKGAILSEDSILHAALESRLGFTPSWIQPWLHTYHLSRPLLSNELLHELKDYDPIESIAQSFDICKIKGRHALDIAQYTWSKTMLECQILNWGGDRVDMANSMESRPAFLDHHFAEFVVTIPPQLRIKGNTEKWILREAMRPLLPDVLYKREKFAFMAPPAHTNETKKNAVKKLVNTFLSPESIRKAGVFDEFRFQYFWEEYQRDSNPASLNRKDALLNHMLSIQILHRLFIQGRSTDSLTAELVQDNL